MRFGRLQILIIENFKRKEQIRKIYNKKINKSNTVLFCF